MFLEKLSALIADAVKYRSGAIYLKVVIFADMPFYFSQMVALEMEQLITG